MLSIRREMRAADRLIDEMGYTEQYGTMQRRDLHVRERDVHAFEERLWFRELWRCKLRFVRRLQCGVHTHGCELPGRIIMVSQP